MHEVWKLVQLELRILAKLIWKPAKLKFKAVLEKKNCLYDAFACEYSKFHIVSWLQLRTKGA